MPDIDSCHVVCQALALAGEFSQTDNSTTIILLNKIVNKENYETIKSAMGGSYADIFEGDYEGYKKKIARHFERLQVDYRNFENTEVRYSSPEFVRAIAECAQGCEHSGRPVDIVYVGESDVGHRFSFVWKPTLPPQDPVLATGFVDGADLQSDTTLFSGDPIELNGSGDYISFVAKRRGTSDIVVNVTVNGRADLSVTKRIPYTAPPALQIAKYRVELVGGPHSDAGGPVGNLYLHILGDSLHLPFETTQKIGKNGHLSIEVHADDDHFYENVINSKASLVRSTKTTNGIQLAKLSLAARIKGQSGWRVFKELVPGWLDRRSPKRSSPSASGDYNMFRFTIRE